MKYSIQIFKPDNMADVLASFTSDTPFQAISREDIINHSGFSDAEQSAGAIVLRVEHFLSESEHALKVYTTSITALASEKLR